MWGKDKPNEPEVKPEAEAPKAPEKSVAEVIAESLSNGLRPVTEGLANLSTRLEAVEQSNKKPVPKADAEGTPSVFENEEVAFQARLGPLALRQLELEARIVRDDIRREYEAKGFGEMWAQYELEINRTLANSPLVQPDGQGGVKALRGDPSYIRNTVNMVIGAAAVKAGVRFDGKTKGFFLESATGDAGGKHLPVDDGLTEAQRKMFSRMGVSPEDAKKSIGKLKFVN